MKWLLQNIRNGGLLFSEHALWNEAFTDFASKTGNTDTRILCGVGFLRKSWS